MNSNNIQINKIELYKTTKIKKIKIICNLNKIKVKHKIYNKFMNFKIFNNNNKTNN